MTRRTGKEKLRRLLQLQAEGLTQAEIADRLGLDQTTVSLAEIRAGFRRRPRRGSFADAATGFALRKPPGRTNR